MTPKLIEFYVYSLLLVSLPRCIDVFVVACVLGENGIKRRKAVLVGLSFGLSAYLMGILGYHLASARVVGGLISILGVLSGLLSLFFCCDDKAHDLSFVTENTPLLFIISLFTAFDVFATELFRACPCMRGSGLSVFIAMDAVLAVIIGYCGIYLGKKHLTRLIFRGPLGCVVASFTSLCMLGLFFVALAINDFRSVSCSCLTGIQ